MFQQLAVDTKKYRVVESLQTASSKSLYQTFPSHLMPTLLHSSPPHLRPLYIFPKATLL